MASAPPRRFVPEPIETTSSKRSRKPDTEESSEPSEPSPKSTRKFEAVPLETSTKTSRRFAPIPLETSVKSHRNGQDHPERGNDSIQEDVKMVTKSTRPRFAPEPIETTTRHHRHVPNLDDDDDEAPLLPHERAVSSIDIPKKAAPRKFAPQLIETATRSRKAGDTAPALLPQDKTNISPGDLLSSSRNGRPGPMPQPPMNSPANSTLQVPQLPKPSPNRQPSIRPHYNTRANTREHCFKVPELETVDSSESEPSEPSSMKQSLDLTEDPMTIGDPMFKDATRIRESVDDRFSGYLLSLAARAAEKQLREQAAAAFVNDDSHEPVNHYIDRDEASDEEVDMSHDNSNDKTRRDSSDDQLALAEMQKHGENVQRRKKTAAFNVEFDEEPSEGNPWVAQTGPHASASKSGGARKKIIGGDQKDPELLKQRKAASPPMLGGDIVFPRCESPIRARFDVTQAPQAVKNSMCYLTEQATQEGLWGARPKTPDPTGSTMRSEATDTSKASCGLWGGMCTGGNKRTSTGPSGLVTPRRTPTKEVQDPFESVGATIAGKRQMPPTPPPSTGFGSVPNEQTLALEEALETEFNDSFVTQVFNYLSLGFPSIARNFDEELSKISAVPVADLQRDDKLAEARGYVRLGDDDPGALDGVDEESSVRWRALRLYIREWARQQPGMGDGRAMDAQRAWGLPARKGSWAF